jgi:hypothetical protein
MLGLISVTAMEDKVAEFTERIVLPEILPEVAVMLAVFAAIAVTRPLVLTVATNVSDELHITCALISWLVKSEYVPVAVNCWVTPTGILGLAGVTAIEDRVAEFTERVVLPDLLPEVAVMLAVPAATAVAKPALLTVATNVFDELQMTCVVISWLVKSEYVPVAVNCWGTPTGMFGVVGVTTMEDRVAEFTERVVLPEEPEAE